MISQYVWIPNIRKGSLADLANSTRYSKSMPQECPWTLDLLLEHAVTFIHDTGYDVLLKII